MNDERRVFDHWCKTMEKNKKTAFTKKREKMLSERLKTYLIDDLFLAIDNCKKNPFNMGDNPHGTVYDSLELIFRDGDQLERYRDMKFVQFIKPQKNVSAALADYNDTDW